MPTKYTAVPGDNLERISAKTGVATDVLQQYNPGLGENGAPIYPGTEIVTGNDEPEPEPGPEPGPEPSPEPGPELGPEPVVADSSPSLVDLYNTGSELADKLHSFLVSLATVIGSTKQ